MSKKTIRNQYDAQTRTTCLCEEAGYRITSQSDVAMELFMVDMGDESCSTFFKQYRESAILRRILADCYPNIIIHVD